VIPVTSAARFFIAFDIIGTNGGELINATEEITIESALTFKNRQMMACMNNDTKIANARNAIILRFSIICKFERSAIEAIANENIYIRYIPRS
jgi:hypothetical protein